VGKNVSGYFSKRLWGWGVKGGGFKERKKTAHTFHTLIHDNKHRELEPTNQISSFRERLILKNLYQLICGPTG